MSPYERAAAAYDGERADVLGVADKLGSLEAGKMADFLVIDPKAIRACLRSVCTTLVFVTSQPDLERVYVGGELMVER